MRFLLRFAPLLGTLALGCSLGFDDSIAGGGAVGGAAGSAGGGTSGGAGTASAGKAGASGKAGGSGASATKGGASGGGGTGGSLGPGGGAGAGGTGASGTGGAGGGNAGAGAGSTAGTGGGSGTGGGASGTGGSGTGGATGGVCSADFDGAQRCQDKTIEQCTEGTWKPLASPCSIGCVQKGVAASCQLCMPNEQSCDEDTLLQCSPDGTKNAPAQLCASTEKVCDASLRACVECHPGDVKCAGGAAFTCRPSGTYDLDGGVQCGSPALCERGTGCKNAVCAPKTVRCTAKGAEICNATGTAYEAGVVCALGTSCVDGKGCVECDKPDATAYCDANKVVSCQGGKRILLATCPEGKCKVDACTECVPGDLQCSADGLTVSQCNGSGQLVPKEACTGADRCRASLGKCAPCEPGAFACEGDTLLQCSPTGTNNAITSCGPGLCSASQQSCLACLPGAARCTGAALETCTSFGQFQQVDSCASAALCDAQAGVCRAPVCSPGERKCGAGRTPQGCKGDRSGFEPSGPACEFACIGAGVCASVMSVAAGGDQSCAIVGKVEGVPVCWGLNQPNLFGGPTGEAAPRVVPGLDHITKIALGDSFACVLGEDGSVRCWGNNGRGQLGDGTTTSRSTYGQVPLPGAASDLSVSVGRGACAVVAGSVYCWGQRAGVPVDDGSDVDLSPVKVNWPVTALSVSVGNTHRCLVDVNQQVACWGSGMNGALGVGGSMSVAQPQAVVTVDPTNLPLNGVRRVSVSSTFNTHTCVAANSGVACWGGNVGGQRGWPPPAGSSQARFVDTGKARELVAAGAQFSCAGYDGSLLCWGSADTGGNGLDSNTPTPTPLTELPGVLDLQAGVGHACALGKSGQVFCWGDNKVGQLGLSSTEFTERSTAAAVQLP